MQTSLINAVATEFRLTPDQVVEIFSLFEDGYTIPYLARYRKDLTGSLGQDNLRMLFARMRDMRRLEKRKREVLKKLRERELLTQELELEIEQAESLRVVNDIFLPYRPKKHSRSVESIGLGVEPLARKLLMQEDPGLDIISAANEMVDAAKGLPDVSCVLQACAYIICDWVAEEKTLRNRQRELIRTSGKIRSRRTKQQAPDRIAKEFKDYFNYEERIQSLHPYRILIISRGVRLNVLEHGIVAPFAAMREAAAELYLDGGKEALTKVLARRTEDATEAETFVPVTGGSYEDSDNTGIEQDSKEAYEFPSLPNDIRLDEFIVRCIEESLQRTLIPVLVRELDRELTDRAEQHAIALFKRNLRSILMQQPLATERLLAISPGYRTGCKLAVLDAKGNLLDSDIVYPHTPKDEIEASKARIEELVKKYEVTVAAIGDGTACRETESLISDLISEKLPDLCYTIVSETGVQSYVSSKASRQELSSIPQSVRSAISIGRHLLDPVRELVKVDPRVLCSSPYVQIVSAKRLKEALADVVEECVCEVGVDLNEADLNLLRNVAGMNGNRARSVLTKRTQLGRFSSRKQLLEVEGIDEKIYRQCAGFLKVCGGDNYLDETRIHPDHFDFVAKLCEELGLDLAKANTPEEQAKLEDMKKQLNLTELESQIGLHYLLIRDIISEVANAWPDPRLQFPAPVLRKSQLKLDEISIGQLMQGVVRNIVDFGVFVDVGVSEDGLIHVSELSDGYVHSPYEVLSTGDIVEVRVIKVDKESGRIALSMRKHGGRSRGRARPRRRFSGSASEGSPRRGQSETAATVRRTDAQKQGKPEKVVPIQVAQSTLGTASRRYQKAQADRGLRRSEGRTYKTKSVSGVEVQQPKGGPKEKRDLKGLLNLANFGKLEKRGKSKE